MGTGAALALLLVLGTAHGQSSGAQYVGKALGALSELHHGVRGKVFAVDSRTLFLQDFHYDGEGPAAFFYVGTSGRPNASGALRLRDERGGTGPLRKYRGEGVTLALPDGKTLRDVRWFSVWCDEYAVNFGDVQIPRELEYPRPAKVGALRGVHGVSSDPIVVVDAQTLLVPNFSYDGEAPDAKFWVGRSEKPSPAGIRIPDENGKEAPLRKYDKKTIVLTLPGELTVFDIGHFAVWCEAFTVNFGHVVLPRAQLANVPPSLKMLGVSPQSRNRALLAASGSTGGELPAVRTGGTRARLTALPATTYRPPQLRAGPAALAAHAQQHEAALRRRADSPASQATANQQLLQPQYQDQKLAHQNQQQFDYRQQYQPVQFYQQQQLQPQQFQQQPNPFHHQLTYQDLLLQQQLLQEQRRLYEHQLYQLQQQRQYEQQTQQSGPVQYHLLPHDFRQQRDASSEGEKERTSEATGEKERASESKLNCEVLYDELAFEVRWAVAGDSIVLQLVAKLEDGEYMSFGVSGDSAHSQMVGGDVAVAWVDKQTLKGYAQDYYLDAKSQCAGVRGSCPDERLGEKTNSIRLLNAALVNGYSIVTYQRSLKAADELDRAVLTNVSQPIIWALGPLNSRQEVSYHHHFTKGDRFIEFGRAPLWNCPMPEGEDEPRTTTTPAPPAPRAPPQRQVSEQESSADRRVIKPNPVPTPKPVARTQAWEIPGIQCYEPPDGVFYAQMGPTGGKQGYPAITGHVGWGISWYINGLLIPEITVVRGRKYTFVVEGGIDPDTPAKYHPFYITNDSVGGFYHKSEEERKNVEIYAGVRRTRSGELIPTGVGRLCNWTPDPNGPEADEYPSFGAYQRSLTLICEQGEPGLVTWTPDKSTPDTVYYQCFTHRYLGWKIRVVDSCEEEEPAESRVAETLVLPDDLAQEESIQVASRVRPDSNFLDERKKVEKIINTKTNYNDFSSDKDADVLTGETYGGRPEYDTTVVSRGQMRDVIEAVENLETRMRDQARNQTANRPHFYPQQQQQMQVDQQKQAGTPHMYQVYEDLAESQPERPIREGDEYVVQTGRIPDTFFLPPAPPRTLQTVLRPVGPGRQPRPPFRRPLPPEIKLRRPAMQHTPPPPSGPQPNNQGHSFPLPMPVHHPPHQMQKKPYGKPMYNRPPQTGNRQPIPPMKAMPPLQHSKYQFAPQKPLVKQPVAPVQGIIMGKPIPGKAPQTLSLGRTDIIANQVVKSQITLPGVGDSVGSSSVQQTYINQPGQIILGKPMDHPVPLDQQMTQSHMHIISAPIATPPPQPKTTTPPHRHQIQQEQHNHPQYNNEIKSSDFIGESTDPPVMQPAVNTGFKPNTIVVESGFKPIIREPLMDRVGGNYDTDLSEGSNRREDTDVEEDYMDSPQPITNHVYQTPSEKLTETFEPMFIPSPPDMMLPTNDITKEVFPSNHAKEDRPHPVYVKTESELNALFSKKNMEKEVPSDMVMESNRVSPQYLPPDPKLPKEHSQKLSTNEQTFTTYDGKIVSADTLTSVPDSKLSVKLFSSKLPARTELLLKTPQFGPFKGEIPPALAGSISSIELPATNTHLKLVNAVTNYTSDELTAAGSEQHEVKVEKHYKIIERDNSEIKDESNKNVTKEKNKDENKDQNQASDQETTTEKEEEYYEDEEEQPQVFDPDMMVIRKRRNAIDSELDFKKLEAEKDRSLVREERETKQIEFDTKATSIATRAAWTKLLLVPLLLNLF